MCLISSCAIFQELFQSSSDLQVLPAARDPNISVCSEVVPSLFSDNFDYGSEDSLIRGVIEQEELLGYTIHCEILDSGYASRVTSFTAYARVRCVSLLLLQSNKWKQLVFFTSALKTDPRSYYVYMYISLHPFLPRKLTLADSLNTGTASLCEEYTA